MVRVVPYDLGPFRTHPRVKTTVKLGAYFGTGLLTKGQPFSEISVFYYSLTGNITGYFLLMVSPWLTTE